MDPPPPGGEEEKSRVFSLVMKEILDRGEQAAPVDDAGWLAMGTYLRLLGERRTAQVGVRCLLIRAGEPTGDCEVSQWPAWDVSDEQVEVAAAHFALIETAAPATATA